VLTRATVDRDLVALLKPLILEQRVDADREVELDEEEENAKLRDLEAEKHSDNAHGEREDQEENIHDQVGEEKVFRALYANIELVD
jgi:hypothetical protein